MRANEIINKYTKKLEELFGKTASLNFFLYNPNQKTTYY
jgi:hypothetical protein